MDFKPSFGRYILLDGSTGINLQKAGMPPGVCPEQWILENPGALISLQQGFMDAGSDAVYAPTFTANRLKLKKYGLDGAVDRINKELVALSRKAVGGRAAVGGNLSSLGVFLRPLGDYTFETIYEIYLEQAAAIEAAGVDFFVIETLMSVHEARAALLAVRSVSTKPVICSFTFEKNNRTLGGTEPLAAMAIIQSMGADVFGINCSNGPEEILRLIQPLKNHTKTPLLSKPNAGMPETDARGNAVYKMTGERFASYVPAFADAGVRLFGGCCGTNLSHIAELNKAISALPQSILDWQGAAGGDEIIASDGRNAFIYDALPEIGRVFEIEEDFAFEIEDFEFGRGEIPGIAVRNEDCVELLEESQHMIKTPLCICGEDQRLIEKALRVYNGRAFVKKGELSGDALKTLSQKYGAVII